MKINWASLYMRILTWGCAGAIGGAIGWELAELLTIPRPSDILLKFLLVASYFVLVGICIGVCIGAVEGVVSGIRSRALGGALFGALLGAVGGALGSVPGELAFDALQGFGMGLVGRAMGWGIVGASIGLGQGVALRDPRRVVRGLLGGLMGGYLGGGFFEIVAALLLGSGVISRLSALVLLGGLIGAFLALIEILWGEAWLRVHIGEQEGTDFVISKNPTIIGRDDRAAVVLTGDPGIALEHVSIAKVGDEYYLRDLQGTGSTLLNGVPITEKALQSGDRIQLSKTILIFKTKAQPQLSQRADVVPVSSAITCRFCGQPNRVQSRFCARCGKPLGS